MSRVGPCITCGLLSRVSAAPDIPHEPLQVSPEMRVSAAKVSLAAGAHTFGTKNMHTDVVCLLRRKEFGERIDGNALVPDSATYFRRLSEDRGCTAWCEFVPAWSPKEHLEHQMMLALRDFEERQRERDRDIARETATRERRLVIKLTLIQLGAAALLAWATSTLDSFLERLWDRLRGVVPAASQMTD